MTTGDRTSLAKRAARLVTTHTRVRGMRSNDSAAWTRLIARHERLIEDAALAWRPDLAWAWRVGKSNGYCAVIGGGVEMYADVCMETGKFHIEGAALWRAASSLLPPRG